MKAATFKPWIAAAACAALAGCATTSQNASLQCGAGGAIGGYLLCKALGGSDSKCLAAAAVIGVGGAAICYNYAGNLERRRKELAGHENDLDRRIAYVRGLNDDSVHLNDDLRKRVASTTTATDQLVAQVRQQKVGQEQLAKERQARDDEVKAAAAQVQAGNQALAEVKAYRAKQKPASSDLDVAIARQEQLLADAQRQVDQLAAQRARVV